MPTILITGGTGLIGTRLTQILAEKNYDVIILAREIPEEKPPNITYALWDVEKETIDNNAVAQADHIIHLSGANVAEKRWTDKRKKEIVESRTKSSELLIKALSNNNKLQTFVSASAIGWYGPDTNASKQKGFNEDAPAANDFLGSTCRLWEASVQPGTTLGKRLVILRTGIVLSNDGGALKEFKKPLKFGIAGILGSGEQTVSWIHIDDLCRLYIYAIENNQLNGIYNAVAPKPESNKALALTLAKKEKGKAYISMHVPEFALKLAMGEMSIEVLKSTTVNADKIKNAGFTFLYPSLEAALQQLVSKK